MRTLTRAAALALGFSAVAAGGWCGMPNVNFAGRAATTLTRPGPGRVSPATSARSQAGRPARPPQFGSRELLLYVGTYTAKTSKGIYGFRMNPSTGKLTPLGLMAETVNPSFLAVHPRRRFLYATNEIGEFEGAKSGAITAFAYEPLMGRLVRINQQPSKGGAPCDIALDPMGKIVLAANYTGGSIVALPIGPDGSLKPATGFVQHEGASVNKQRQEAAHAHSIGTDAEGRFVYCADLGIDKVLTYRLDATAGTLTANGGGGVTAPGSGPRHFKLHPNGRFGYVINELNSTITAFEHDPRTAALKEIQVVSTLPEDFKGTNHPAELMIHPNGRFLYGSNRGHDSLAICTIDVGSGKLKVVGHQATLGKTPRNFTFDPSGKFLLAANQDSDNIVVFRVDQSTGKLTDTGERAEVSMPVCIVFGHR